MTRTSRAGFTLVELVLVALLSITLSGLVLNLSLTSNNVRDTIYGQGTLQMSLAAAMDQINQDARLAMYTPQSRTCCGGTLYTRDLSGQGGDVGMGGNPATLLFVIPSVTVVTVNGQSETTVIANTFDYVIYTYDAATGVLRRLIDANDASSRSTAPGSAAPDQTLVVARDVTQVTWTITPDLITPREIQTFLAAQRTENRRTFSASLTAQGKFRNALLIPKT